VKLRSVKREIRVLGIDGVELRHRTGKSKHIIGAVFRGRRWLDGVMHIEFRDKQLDLTKEIGLMIKESPHYGQLRAVMIRKTGGAPLESVDHERLHAQTSLPVIAVEDRIPYRGEKACGKPSAFAPKPTLAQIEGISMADAEAIFKTTSTQEGAPEPLRIAHSTALAVKQLMKQNPETKGLNHFTARRVRRLSR